MTVEPDTCVWWDHYSADLEAAAAFYDEWLPWSIRTVEPGGDGPYPMWNDGTRDAGGFLHFEEVAPHWHPYLAVEEHSDALERVAAAGGEIVADLGWCDDFGHVGIARAPDGTPFSVLAPARTLIMPPEPPLYRLELAVLETPDPVSATRFWRAVLGWEMRPTGPGGTAQLMSGQRPMARVVLGLGPGRFVPELRVPNTIDAIARGEALGATLVSPRRILDPDGALLEVQDA